MNTSWLTWEHLLTKFLPLKIYQQISYDIAEIFTAAVYQYPPARDMFSQMSISAIQQFVNNNATAAQNYDPHGSINDIRGFLTGLYQLVETLLVAIIILGTIAGIGLWVTYSRGLLDTFGSITQILISVILSGPAILVLPAGLALLYFRFLAFNTFVINVLNDNLVIGPPKTNSRNERELIGYGMWNSSLDGGSAIQLLVIFSILWVGTAVIPKYDPYGYIKSTVTDNIDLFATADGNIDAVKRAYSRLRESD